MIERRYYRGIANLTNLYIPLCDRWIIMDNTKTTPLLVAEGKEFENIIINHDIWNKINM